MPCILGANVPLCWPAACSSRRYWETISGFWDTDFCIFSIACRAHLLVEWSDSLYREHHNPADVDWPIRVVDGFTSFQLKSVGLAAICCRNPQLYSSHPLPPCSQVQSSMILTYTSRALVVMTLPYMSGRSSPRIWERKRSVASSLAVWSKGLFPTDSAHPPSEKGVSPAVLSYQ